MSSQVLIYIVYFLWTFFSEYLVKITLKNNKLFLCNEVMNSAASTVDIKTSQQINVLACRDVLSCFYPPYLSTYDTVIIFLLEK